MYIMCILMLRIYFYKGDKMADEEVMEIMKEVDTDGDGKIDYQGK